jgi:hypothetical protein
MSEQNKDATTRHQVSESGNSPHTLSPSSHKFDDEFIPSGLSAEGASAQVWAR